MNLKHALLLTALTLAALAAADTKDLINQGRTELQAACAQSTEDAYRKAEHTIC